jgi:hypothetical protein
MKTTGVSKVYQNGRYIDLIAFYAKAGRNRKGRYKGPRALKELNPFSLILAHRAPLRGAPLCGVSVTI